MASKLLKLFFTTVLCVSLMPLAGLGSAWADEDGDTGQAGGDSAASVGAPGDEGDGPGIGAGGTEAADPGTQGGDVEGVDPGNADGADNAGAPAAQVPPAPQGDGGSSLDTLSGEPYSVDCQAHVQNIGWQAPVTDGATAGTTGRGLRVEALRVSLAYTGDAGSELSGSIEYRAHVQNIGWQGWVADGAMAGTTGRSLRMEAVSIRLTGDLADAYDVYYRVHVQNFGWLAWTSDGADAGSSGYGYRMEAVQVMLVAKAGGTAPDTSGDAFKKPAMAVQARAQVQNIGWQGWVSNGAVAGTTGRSLRMEAVCLSVANPDLAGSIEYRAQVQNIGWQGWVADGAVAGTVGRSLRMEAVQVQLTGDLAASYHVYYRAHVANYGWLGWACDGATAGTVGLSDRMEALQVVLVRDGDPAPGPAGYPSIEASLSAAADSTGLGWLSPVGTGSTIGTTGQSRPMQAFNMSVSSPVAGSIQYNACMQDGSWQGWQADGAVAGDTSGTGYIEALQVRLTGDLASYFDVYYRAHVSGWGWLGWAKNGASAGTTTAGHDIEAIQVIITIKGAAAPGSVSGAYITYTTGDAWLDAQLLSICTSHGFDLRSCFNYVSNFSYRTESLYPTGDWAPAFAKDMLQNGSGNCYRYAALFCCLAKMLGYDATVVSGWVPSYSQGKAPHGWVEIRMSGQVYVCDADMYNSYRNINWYMMTYANTPCTYGFW